MPSSTQTNRPAARAIALLFAAGLATSIGFNPGCASSRPSTEVAGAGVLSLSDAQYIESLAAGVLDAARVPAGQSVAGQPANSSGGTLIRPGGGDAYPAFWIRNFAMSLDSGLISLEEQRHALLQTAFHQQDGQMMLPNGARVPQGSVPNHITLDGVPIFFPGTLDDYVSQGGGAWGVYPCFDNPFYFIHMAFYYVHAAEDYALLQMEVRNRTLLKRLQLAYSMPPHNSETGLVTCSDTNRGINFGFADTVEHTGDLLFASLLKLRAAIQLAALMDATGNRLAGDLYREDAAHIREAIAAVFPLESGFLRASTGRSAQTDAWGTALAVYLGALPLSWRCARVSRWPVVIVRGRSRRTDTCAMFPRTATTAKQRCGNRRPRRTGAIKTEATGERQRGGWFTQSLVLIATSHRDWRPSTWKRYARLTFGRDAGAASRRSTCNPMADIVRTRRTSRRLLLHLLRSGVLMRGGSSHCFRAELTEHSIVGARYLWRV